MKIIASYPENAILKKYIRYIYFLENQTDEFSFDFYAFPNTGSAITLHHHSESQSLKNTILINESRKAYEIKLKMMRKEPVLMRLNGKIDEVTIVFEPLGINHFINTPIHKICLHPDPSNIPFNIYEDRLSFCSKLFTAKDIKERTRIIEMYLLTKYNPFSNVLLQRAIELIQDSKGERKIAEVAREININIKALERLFIKHMHITPVTFRTIVRFRSALNIKKENPEETYTHMAYASSFYDQAHFINMFKKITGKSPRGFFKNMKAMADKNYIIAPVV